MSKDSIELTLFKRDTIGKGLNKLRKDGKIPAVIHIPGKESLIVSGTYNEINKVYNEAGKRHPVDVSVGKDKYLTIIKDIDFNVKNHAIRHVVFDMIKQDKKVEIEVPIVFEGDCPALKAGLVLEKQLEHVNIEAFPKDLPDEVVVNVEKLVEIGDRVTVADIKAPEGVEILVEPEHPVATVEEKQIIVEEEPEVEETSEGEETSEKTETAAESDDQEVNE